MPTMAELIAQVRRRTDTENSAFVTDPELADYLNDSIAELYAELMVRWGDEYFVTQVLGNVAAGTNILAFVPALIPDPPLRILNVSLGTSDGKIIPLHSFSFTSTVISSDLVDWDLRPPRYKLRGVGAIEFDSLTSTQKVIAVPVIRAPRRFAAASVDDITELYAWREFVILDTCIKVLGKEESDTAALEARKQILLGRISANAPPRDAASVKLINDDRSLQGWAEDWL